MRVSSGILLPMVAWWSIPGNGNWGGNGWWICNRLRMYSCRRYLYWYYRVDYVTSISLFSYWQQKHYTDVYSTNQFCRNVDWLDSQVLFTPLQNYWCLSVTVACTVYRISQVKNKYCQLKMLLPIWRKPQKIMWQTIMPYYSSTKQFPSSVVLPFQSSKDIMCQYSLLQDVIIISIACCAIWCHHPGHMGLKAEDPLMKPTKLSSFLLCVVLEFK